MATAASRRVRGLVVPPYVGAGRARSRARWRRACRVSHGTAGRLRVSRSTSEDLGIEMVSPLGRHKRLDGVVGHRSGALFDVRSHRSTDRSRRQRSPATLVDVSGRLTERKLGRGHRRCAATTDPQPRRPAPNRGPTWERLRTIDEEGASVHWRCASPATTRSKATSRPAPFERSPRRGLPVPRQQYPVALDGHLVTWISPIPKCGSASSSTAWSGIAPRSAFDDDHRRDAALIKIGWITIRLTASMTDDEMVAVVRAALTDRLLTRGT